MALFSKRPSVDENPHATIQDCLRKRDYKGALSAFEALLKKPGSGANQLRMRYADTLVLAGRKADAVREYSAVAEELAETGFLVRAVAVYKKVVKLDPSQADAVDKLARLDAVHNAERRQQSIESQISHVSSVGGATSAISLGGASDVLGDFEEDDGGMDLDIGMGSANVGTAPASPVARSREPEISLEAMDDGIDAVDAMDAIGASDLEPAAPVPARSIAPVLDLGMDADLAPDSGLLAPDLEDAADEVGAALVESAGALLAPDVDLVAPDEIAATPTLSASLPDAGSGLGFDFGFGSSPAGAPTAADVAPSGALDFGFSSPPAAAPTSSDEPAGAGLGMAFAAPPAAQPGFAAPPSSGLDFGFSGEVAADPGFGFSPGGGADLNSASAGLDGGEDDLLGLLGDDIDSMLDGIMSDLDDNQAGVALDLPPVSTNIGLFSHLAIDEFIEVLKILDRTTAKRGDAIVKQGDPGVSMFIITTGRVEATIERDGSIVPVATLADGNFFGEMSVLSGEPRTATVTAVENTELLVLERSQLLQLLSRHPGVEAKLLLAQAERADQTAAIKAAAPPLG